MFEWFQSASQNFSVWLKGISTHMNSNLQLEGSPLNLPRYKSSHSHTGMIKIPKGFDKHSDSHVLRLIIDYITFYRDLPVSLYDAQI